MKLLRLTSNTNNGIIDTNFNEDIKIDADSQISLMNTSFSINTKQFIVSSAVSKRAGKGAVLWVVKPDRV